MDSVDTELSQLNLSEQLRANSSFMKIIATLFHYGNQSMSAAQLVSAVRTLDLLQLRGETPKSTVQGIISTSRKIARDLRLPDPFRIDKDAASRQAKYAIADDVLNGATMPEKTDIPDEPIILRPVEHATNNHYYTSSSSTGKRARKTTYYDGIKRNCRKRTKSTKKKEGAGSDGSDIEVDSDEDFELAIESEDETPVPEVVEEDTIFDYSLLYSPPPSDASYIDAINFSEYPIAAHFAIVQQKGYSYPRFRSHEKIKIPKLNCEDKFRVTDIVRDSKVVGRMFIIADGHGGPGCSEYFVRNTPAAVQALCDHYEDLADEKTQQQFTKDIKKMVQQLDETYLKIKRAQLYNEDAQEEDQHIDNDGCTLIINVFLGGWLVNVNVGDSRSIVISAPEPSKVPPSSIENANTAGIDTDYKMDVVFASQDHKPYLEHLAREILENGGEFVDSVQNRVIKVELDKLKEDGNRHTKRIALKNARIRPKGYHQAGHDHQSTNNNGNETAVAAAGGWAAQSAVRTTAQQANNNNNNIASIHHQHHHQYNRRMREDRIPSLNVARSCGDLDFKMDPKHKIISCEPDVTFIRISDQPQNEAGTTILANGPHKERRRHFLFMSTDGTFDYMYEETADRQNRAIAKVIGPMIEDGEKIGQYLLEEEERIKGQTIEHKSDEDKKDVKQQQEPAKTEDMDVDVDSGDAKNTTNQAETQKLDKDEPVKSEKDESNKNEQETDDGKNNKKKSANTKTKDEDKQVEKKDDENLKTTDTSKKEETEMMNVDAEKDESKKDHSTTSTTQGSIKQDGPSDKASEDMQVDTAEAPRVPLLHRELSLEETQARKIKERTLVMSARYFANRESAHGFFASTLQDYDDCTIILVEI